MLIPYLGRHRHLPSALGAFLLFCSPVFPALAQTGNQSDVSGTILSTSDFAGQTLPVTTPVTVFQGGESAQSFVNQAATSVNARLGESSLASPSGETLPAATQQGLLAILTGGEQAGASVNTIAASLAAAPGAPPAAAIQNLLSSLEELTKNKKVVPAKLLAAVRAYNKTILASNEEFLSNPPAELVAIQAILRELANPATS